MNNETTFKYKSWRPDRNVVGAPGEKVPDKKPSVDLQAVKIFDQLSFIGTNGMACFVLETSQGLIMIESMEPTQRCMNLIIRGFEDLGYKFEDLKAVLISHAHYDHFGCAGILRRLCGCKAYITKGDYEVGTKVDLVRPHKVLMWEPDGFLADGDEFVLGDTTVYCSNDPENPESGLSMIFRVTDSGEEHWVGFWGGTSSFKCEPYLKSLEHFRTACNKFGCDVEIYPHGHIDNTEERLEICRNIVNGVANPFVIGNEAFNRFLDWHAELAVINSKKTGW